MLVAESFQRESQVHARQHDAQNIKTDLHPQTFNHMINRKSNEQFDKISLITCVFAILMQRAKVQVCILYEILDQSFQFKDILIFSPKIKTFHALDLKVNQSDGTEV